jgi:hypothetical protein
MKLWTQFQLWGWILFLSPSASAWENHQSLMPGILNGASSELKQKLKRMISVPCEAEDHKIYSQLAHELQLNVTSHVPNTAPRKCDTDLQMSIQDLLLSGMVDDPDRGMDQNLPETADAAGDRKWMGGKTGPTSQGFRHMYFGGWKFFQHPITTFQIPVHAIGQAPHRAELIAQKAKELYHSGQEAWGIRLLAWSMHYLQDLAQPFHSVEIISVRMVPWASLFNWPPSDGFSQLVKETTRVVSNYHYAYEEYTLNQIGVYTPCLENSKLPSGVQWNRPAQRPVELAHAVSQSSIQIASDLGKAETQFFGKQLFQPEYNLPLKQGTLNYSEYAQRADLIPSRELLHEVTCHALHHAAEASRNLIKWTLEP